MHSNNTTDAVEAIHRTTGPPDPLKIWALTLAMGNIIIFICGVVFCVVSWCRLLAWRRFKNYIFLNTIFVLFSMNISFIGCFSHWPCCHKIMHLINELSMAVLANWVLVMCMVIYTKILKVFSGDLRNKYVKSNIFTWGLALVEHAVSAYHYRDPLAAVLCITHSVTFVAFGFYLSVVYALLKLTTVRMVSKDNSIQIVKIFFYVTSAVAMMTLMQGKEYYPEYRDEIWVSILILEQVFIFSFVSMKTHRVLWKEYFKTEAGQRDVLRTMM